MEYLSLEINMLTNSLKISDTSKMEFSDWKSFTVIKKHDKTTSMQISVVLQTF